MVRMQKVHDANVAHDIAHDHFHQPPGMEPCRKRFDDDGAQGLVPPNSPATKSATTAADCPGSSRTMNTLNAPKNSSCSTALTKRLIVFLIKRKPSDASCGPKTHSERSEALST